MNVFPLQLGGLARSEFGADAHGLFPAPTFTCPDPDNGIEGTCYRSPTAGHRGYPHFVNSRVIDFSEYDKCEDGCSPYYPLDCITANDCPLEWYMDDGWGGQESVWNYYYRLGIEGRFGQGPRSIHALLEPGDRLDLVLMSSLEINECVNFELMRAIEQGTGQLRTKCGDIPIGDPIDLSEPMFCDYWDLGKEHQADKCVGWEMLQLEILDFPEVPADDEKCASECYGKLHKLAFNVAVSGRTRCTGK